MLMIWYVNETIFPWLNTQTRNFMCLTEVLIVFNAECDGHTHFMDVFQFPSIDFDFICFNSFFRVCEFVLLLWFVYIDDGGQLIGKHNFYIYTVLRYRENCELLCRWVIDLNKPTKWWVDPYAVVGCGVRHVLWIYV